MSERTRGLILQQKWEDMAGYIYAAILRNMPKSERFSLGADIRSLIWEVDAVLVQLAQKAGNRMALLDIVDCKAKILMTMIRVGIAVEAIPQKRYKVISEKLAEIGRIIGGMKKRAGY